MRFGKSWLRAQYRHWHAFAPLVIVYIALGVLYALSTPLWQAPDEPAHYNYVRYVAENRRLPVLQMGDFPVAYLEEIKAKRFPPEMSIEPIRYESWQPPLYYVLAAGLLVPARSLPLASQVWLLRLFSVLLGAGVIAVAYSTAREIFPNYPSLAWGTAAFAAAVPMYVATTAAISNDALAELLVGGVLLSCVRALKRGVTARTVVWLGLLAGLGLLAKMSVVIAVPLVMATVWLDARRTKHESEGQGWAFHILLFLGVTLLVCGVWFVRNGMTYGWNDLLIWRRHGEVVQGQLTTAQYLAENGWKRWIGALMRVTFQSFWAQFGWMAVPVDRRIYQALWLLCVLSAVGLALFVVRQVRRQNKAVPSNGILPDRLEPWQWEALGLLGLLLVFSLFSYLWYNARFVQFQGRYLFTALVPLGLAFALGLAELVGGGHERELAALLGFAALLALALRLVMGWPDKWCLLLLAGGFVALLFRRVFGSGCERFLFASVYLALLVFTAVCPALFIVPYLAPA
ncbi:MAG: DUF2142 domain-containing protein [Candidatus Hadarchaeum sp.]